MAHAITHRPLNKELPDWVSSDVRLYLEHIEGGVTIRALARVNGVHASTILRKVRKTESRRDDPLIDKVLIHLGKLRRVQGEPQVNPKEAVPEMTDAPPDEVTLKRDATRILRALMQTGAVLAVVPDVETAVVVVEAADGRPRQVATVESRIAQAMA
ncbi:MAG: helix-turn-helix domain-containing protein, partial [Rhodobacteraceae bacterium]|nr:helix-turn-helix domain-containing protein [Paracoccaceae bacterium]